MIAANDDGSRGGHISAARGVFPLIVAVEIEHQGIERYPDVLIEEPAENSHFAKIDMRDEILDKGHGTWDMGYEI
jgi:hypothetical protein